MSDQFTHQVTSPGPAQGLTFSGRRRIGRTAGTGDLPLIIAVHGGGFTSAYFDVPGYSLLDRAAALEVPIIAVDRPGYGGSNPVPAGEPVLLANAAALDHLITELWAANGAGSAGVFVVGHSIGAAVSLAVAARKPEWPLLGLALSGCLLREPASFADRWAALPGATLRSPDEDKATRMFGPAWTYRSDMPKASYFANVAVLKAELVEISSAWHDLFRALAPEISVPVHLRQGEFEKLWITDHEQVAEFAAALTASPWVDAEVFRSAGHAIDYHRVGAAFQLQQLSFALTCAARRVAECAD
ncbi:alpha/beta hydrolase [Amycolatopsis thermoflava]|uniref:alpha/beta hydrolase n=1 Tax=Amycolatopsis thermoflava TaxID=84480 RepID=UPI000405E284|nr:alpha/beta hydrolase [Amycolatopsis thermoflava]